jgi:hypothetical protein
MACDKPSSAVTDRTMRHDGGSRSLPEDAGLLDAGLSVSQRGIATPNRRLEAARHPP